MGFAVWIDEREKVIWAQGTHEYRPMGTAVVAVCGLFRLRDFQRERKRPPSVQRMFIGFFGSLEEVNRYIGAGWKTRRPRLTPAHLL